MRSIVRVNECTELSSRLSRLTRIIPISQRSRSRWSKCSRSFSASSADVSRTYCEGMYTASRKSLIRAWSAS